MNAFPNRHDQPGRRFATGATRDDILLGAFGFVSHLFFFMFLGALTLWFLPEYPHIILIGTGAPAGTLLLIRALQVGSSTTKESIAAIKAAIID